MAGAPQMRDPRGGTGVHIQLEGDGAWPDLQGKHFFRARDIHVAALAKGTVEGHAAVAMRFDVPHGPIVVAELTLRELHGIWTSVVNAYGEDWMKPASADMELRVTFVVQELTRQLLEAKEKLGEAPVLDFTAADRAYEAAKRAQSDAGGAS
jgi:hypothetical protein